MSASHSSPLWQEAREEGGRGKAEPASLPARALILEIMHARRVLLIINLTTPTINPTMVSNNYRLTLGGGLLWSHVCQGEGGQ